MGPNEVTKACDVEVKELLPVSDSCSSAVLQCCWSLREEFNH